MRKFFYLVVLPLLVFLLYSVDVQAAGAYHYEIHSYFSDGGTPYKWEVVIDTDRETIMYYTGETFGSRAGVPRLAFMFSEGDDRYATAYQLANGNVWQTAGTTQYYLQNGTWKSGTWHGSAEPYYFVGTMNNLTYTADSSMMIFQNYNSALAYLKSGDKSGWTNKPPIDLEQDGELDDSIPVPFVVFEKISTGCPKGFTFSNAEVKYNVEIKGRYNSVDDLQWFRSGVGIGSKWLVRYFTTLQGDLEDWVSVADESSSIARFYFEDVGAASLANLLRKYPPENRTFRPPEGSAYYQSFDYSFNHLEDDTRDVLLTNIDSVFNAPEMYIRFWYEDEDGSVYYGKWAHALYTLPDSEGSDGSWLGSKEMQDGGIQSQEGLTTDDLDRLESTGSSISDPNLVPDRVLDPLGDVNMVTALSSFSDLLKQFGSVTTGVVGFFVSVFSFLPWWVTALLSLSITTVVILRFLGR